MSGAAQRLADRLENPSGADTDFSEEISQLEQEVKQEHADKREHALSDMARLRSEAAALNKRVQDGHAVLQDLLSHMQAQGDDQGKRLMGGVLQWYLDVREASARVAAPDQQQA